MLLSHLDGEKVAMKQTMDLSSLVLTLLFSLVACFFHPLIDRVAGDKMNGEESRFVRKKKERRKKRTTLSVL